MNATRVKLEIAIPVIAQIAAAPTAGVEKRQSMKASIIYRGSSFGYILETINATSMDIANEGARTSS